MVVNKKINIITNGEFEAMIPTTGTFIQQPKPQAARTHDETEVYKLEAHEVLNAQACFPLQAWSC